MADNTKIEWAAATVNYVNGCSVISAGCTNCYAMRLAGTRLKHHPSRAGLTRDTKAGPVWTGEVRANETALLQPLAWKRPRRIFWNAHGDLFHESVPDAWIDRQFAVMALTPQHTHMVLTKRPERMRAYLAREERVGEWLDLMDQIDGQRGSCLFSRFPLPNVWLGTSVEDQRAADERIPHLLATPAAVRFLSCEPLLGPVDLSAPISTMVFCGAEMVFPLSGELADWLVEPIGRNAGKIDWVIAGGESGPGARPMHPDWARSLRDQCAAAGVAFHFKQWGEWAPSTPEAAAGNPRSGWRCLAGHPHVPKAAELYPEAGAAFIEHMGKPRAGRLLDGRTHDDFPGAPN